MELRSENATEQIRRRRRRRRGPVQSQGFRLHSSGVRENNIRQQLHTAVRLAKTEQVAAQVQTVS